MAQRTIFILIPRKQKNPSGSSAGAAGPRGLSVPAKDSSSPSAVTCQNRVFNSSRAEQILAFISEDLNSALSFSTETRSENCSVVNSILDECPVASLDFRAKSVLIGRECAQRNLENRPFALFTLFRNVGSFEIGPDVCSEPLTCYVSRSLSVRVHRAPSDEGCIALAGPRFLTQQGLVRASPTRSLRFAGAFCARARLELNSLS